MITTNGKVGVLLPPMVHCTRHQVSVMDPATGVANCEPIAVFRLNVMRLVPGLLSLAALATTTSSVGLVPDTGAKPFSVEAPL